MATAHEDLFREIRSEKVAENLNIGVIGVRRGPEHDEWEASIADLFRAAQIRDGVFSVSKTMTVGELLKLHPDWCWHFVIKPRNAEPPKNFGDVEMSKGGLPRSGKSVVATLAEIYRRQGKSIAELLVGEIS